MQSSRGQVGIIILLVVVVVSTIGISVVSRTSTDVSLSRSNEASNSALDAAESGVEQALSNAADTDPTNANKTTGSVTSIPGVSVGYTVDRRSSLTATVDEGASVGLDVTGAANGNTLTIAWAKETDCTTQTPASLAVTVYKTVGSTPMVRKYYAGACPHNPDDGFPQASAGSNGYFRTVDIPLEAGDVLVRIRTVYNQSDLVIAGSGGYALPVQQFLIRSTAQQDSGKETKAVQVDRSLPMPPSVFDYTLFSGTTISNN